jgi:tetratricopeptide (TPR) repeat protein
MAGLSACRCGADLTFLRRIDAVADAWFNRGLEAMAAGSAGRAVEWLSACCAARPADAAARRAQARAWARLGCLAEAREALEIAAEAEPDSADLPALRAALIKRQPSTRKTRHPKARA